MNPSKLSDAQVLEIAHRWRTRLSLKQLAAEYNVSIYVISRALNERYRRLVRKGVAK